MSSHSWSKQAGRTPLVIAGGRGSTVWDDKGRHYLDFSSQLVNTNIGHQHPAVVAAIKAQADVLCTIAPQHVNDHRSEAARQIVELAPEDMSKVWDCLHRRRDHVRIRRTGAWLAIDHWDARPDLITFAKGVNSGYVPLGGVIISDPIARHFDDRPFPGGLTYSGHPLACAPAVATIDTMRQEKIAEHAASSRAARGLSEVLSSGLLGQPPESGRFSPGRSDPGSKFPPGSHRTVRTATQPVSARFKLVGR